MVYTFVLLEKCSLKIKVSMKLKSKVGVGKWLKSPVQSSNWFDCFKISVCDETETRKRVATKSEIMCDQESLQLQDEESMSKSMHQLTSAAPESYTKRHSPSHFQEPNPKRATHLLGYKKLLLPHSFPAAAPLRRTLSEPIYSPGTNKSSEPIQLANAMTPPRPPAGRNSSRSPMSGGSHKSKVGFN